MLELSKNFKSHVDNGLKVIVFKEVGKDDLCIQSLLENTELVVTDKHQYSYVTVAQKDLDSASLKGCAEINLIKNDDLSVTGLHYPVFVSRPQEFKKFDIIWSFRAKLESEGIED